uniref:Arf-GAP with coiled-coil, ANK repeat and PH domain-containing protein n=1 Tax=Cyprinus carpio TaxID=7962 RepID=A0A8C2AMP2_CYPCA
MERSRNRLNLYKYNSVCLSLSVHQLVKLCSGMIEAGRVYISANKLFVNGIRDLSHHCKKEEMISGCLEKCGESLQEIVNYHLILFDQAQRSVKQQLHNFVKEDVRKFKETKKQFDKVREDMEIAQVKNAQAPRNKPHEVEEATSTLITTRKCFRHLALDYVLQINVLQAKKKFEILDSMLSFMQAQYSLFQQGFNLLDEIDPYMKKLAAELDQLVIDSAMEKREMEHKHATIQQAALFLAWQDFAYDDSKVEFNVDAPNGVVMEGYLFKRASNAFKTWNRRWFSIQNSQLVYQKRLKDALTVVVEDLRLCSVKPCEDIERRFCFEVVSPTKSCMLQAESEKLRQAWIQAVQASIASAYREISDNYYIERLDRTASPSTSSIDSASEPRERIVKGESILQRVQSLPGNEICCDCGQADPRWASINLGILLCIECSGIHRSLGVHCSKVRSLTLDTWEPELMKLMCELGNAVINQIYEGACEEQRLKKPGPSSSRSVCSVISVARIYYFDYIFFLFDVIIFSYVQCFIDRSSRLSAAAAKFRRESLFCPDELDSLFSYFDTGSGPRSNDSGLGGSTDGKCEDSDESSGEVDIEQEASDLEDGRELDPNTLLYKASRARNLPVMAEALAHGADINSVSEEDESKSPLIQAVAGAICPKGSNTPIYLRITYRLTLCVLYVCVHRQVCLFLKRGASQVEVDEDGQDPLSIAVQAANADIVTLLRLARMNEEMREADGPFGQPGQYPSSSPTEQQYRNNHLFYIFVLVLPSSQMTVM